MYSRFFFNEGSGLTITDQGNAIGDITLAGSAGAAWSTNAGWFTPAEENTYTQNNAELDDLFDLNQGGGLLFLFNCTMTTAQTATRTIFTWGGSGSQGYIKIVQPTSNRFTASIRMTGGASTELSLTSSTDTKYLNSNSTNFVVALSIDVSMDYPCATLAIIFPDAADSATGASLSAEAPLKIDGTAWPSIANGNCAFYLFRNHSDEGLNPLGTEGLRVRDIVIKRYEASDNLYQLRGRISGEMLSDYVPYNELYLGNYTNG